MAYSYAKSDSAAKVIHRCKACGNNCTSEYCKNCASVTQRKKNRQEGIDYWLSQGKTEEEARDFSPRLN